MPIAKAFLSHSTSDKAFVEAVAKRLGRQQVKFDKWAFEAGEDFEKAIDRNLDASVVFVLFASKASLESLWVKYEAKQAHIRLLTELMKSALVFIIDSEISHPDLPKWMQKSLVKRMDSSSSVARAIQYQLNNIRGVEQAPLFYGRNGLLASYSEKLFPPSGSKPPHVLIVSGLEGVGRRTFLSRAIKDNLNMEAGPFFHLRRTDGIDALHIALITELGDANSVPDLARKIAAFRKKSAEEKADELSELLHRIGQENVAPCIVDDGALLESNAEYKPEALALFDSLKKHPETIIGLIHTHRPRMNDLAFYEKEACYERIPPLDLNSTKQLLGKRLQAAKIEYSSDQVDSLVPYLGGYPPAVNLAVGLAEQYGMPLILADKSMLVDFQIQAFSEVLSKLNLDDLEWGILRLLAAGLDLPVDALAAALKITAEAIAPQLRRMVDLNLVLVSNPTYSIAYPIKFAVQSARGTLSQSEFSAIGNNLKNTFWNSDTGLPTYEVIESTISALLHSSDPDLEQFAGIVVPSLLFRAAKDSYEQWGHANWERALILLGELLTLEPSHRGGLVLFFKIQVKMTMWGEADKTLKQIQANKLPERFALEGYLYWKQRKYSRAASLYKVALSNGERAVEIYHGLANCLFQLGNDAEATKYIREGLENRARHNGLLLDLAAKMAIVGRRFDEAADYINQLKRLNAMTDYHHRAATLFAALKKPAEALPHAREALNGARGRYEIDSVLISILIDLSEFMEANERLDLMEKSDRASGVRRDVRLGLRVKLNVRQGDWKAAEGFWEALGDKKSAVQKALRMELLEHKLADKSLPTHIRASAREEFKELSGDFDLSGEGSFLSDDYEGSFDFEADSDTTEAIR